MRLKYLVIIILFSLFISDLTFSQIDSTQANIQKIIDELLQEPSTETDRSDLVERIEDMVNNPIDLNSADITELQEIPTVNFIVAQEILKFRKKHRRFNSTNDLFLVNNISKEEVNKILPFVKIENGNNVGTPNLFYDLINKSKIKIRSRFVNELQTGKGFLDGKFIGAKPKYYNRFQLNSDNNYLIGGLIEKDPGENSLNDFSSFYLYVKNLKKLSNLILGDYLLEFGQGLVLWSPYGFSKGADAVYPIKKKNRPISPYRSTNENNYFRGIGVTLKLNNFKISSFYSNNNFDANIDTTNGDILSAPLSGLHRTTSEIKKKNTAKEIFKGLRIDYSNNIFFNIGFLFYNSHFSNSFNPSSIFKLSGNNFNFYSIYYDIYFKNINFFGEIAYNSTSVASVSNVQFSFGNKLIFITSIRSYPRNFTNLHGLSISENSGKVNNEFGIYNGIKWKSPIGEVNFYFDQFNFPFTTFSNPISTQGNELLLNITTKLNRKITTTFRYKIEKKEITKTVNINKQIIERKRQNFRGEFIYKSSGKLRFRTRFELSNYRINSLNINEVGYLIFQDIKFRPSKVLALTYRFIIFNTDSFNSSVYEFENDLPGVLSNIGLSDNGLRWYLIVNFRPTGTINLSLKYSETVKSDKKSLGSGESLINGNLKNNISFQFDFNL